MTDKEIWANRFKLIREIGEGGFSIVYECKDNETKERLAMKVIKYNAGNYKIYEKEKNIHGILSDIVGFRGVPELHSYGRHDGNYFIVMQLLGPSLSEKLKLCGGKFSLRTTLMLAYQMIEIIEQVHEKGIIHRDIKPGNFVMGINETKYRLYLIDFGLASKFCDLYTQEHVAYKENCGFCGNDLFCSINTHLGVRRSRRDDMESIGYMLIYLYRGSLPWQHIHAATDEEEMKKIVECKQNTAINTLCEGCPEEFATYMTYVRNLEFEERPNYKELKRLLSGRFNDEDYEFDYQYDWVTKESKMKQAEKQGQLEQKEHESNQ